MGLNVEFLVSSVDYGFGETLEINYGSWNESKSEYDISIWHGDTREVGFTLNDNQLKQLYDHLKVFYADASILLEEEIYLFEEDTFSVIFKGFEYFDNSLKILINISTEWGYKSENNFCFEDVIIDGEIRVSNSDFKKKLFQAKSIDTELVIDDISPDEDHKIEFYISNYHNGAFDVSDKVVAKVNFLQKRIEIINNETDDDFIEEGNYLDGTSFLIRNDDDYCCGHDVERIVAFVKLSDGYEVWDEKIDAFFCYNCNLYFINESQFKQLEKKGIILCNVYKYQEYKNIKPKLDSGDLRPESMINKLGYNVDAKKDLSERERRRILDLAIENGVMRRAEVISHLEWNIRIRKNERYNSAKKKWQSDINYLRNQNGGVNVSSFKDARWDDMPF